VRSPSLLRARRAQANGQSQLGFVSRFTAYAFFVWSDGLLLHWQASIATYCLLAVGSLITYGPFLVVKVPILGTKARHTPTHPPRTLHARPRTLHAAHARPRTPTHARARRVAHTRRFANAMARR
jgi:hypothetical protein